MLKLQFSFQLSEADIKCSVMRWNSVANIV